MKKLIYHGSDYAVPTLSGESAIFTTITAGAPTSQEMLGNQ